MENYLQIIDGKTASLLACSAELGAYYSGADTDTVEMCRLFGQKIGIAFQMVDDILDIVGETDNVGKTLQTDLVNSKLTLPVILYLQNATEEQKQTMLKWLHCGNAETHNIVQTLIQSGAVQTAQQRVNLKINEALEILSAIDGQKEIKSAMEEVTRFVAQRNM
jgi:geranylgeranyl pyrophosphate synthase